MPRPPEQSVIGDTVDIGVTVGTSEVTSSETDGWGALPRPPEQSVIGDAHRIIDTALIFTVVDFSKEDSQPQSLLAPQADTLHEAFKGTFGPSSMDAFVGALRKYNKGLNHGLLGELDAHLCNVFAQRAEESAHWLSIVMPKDDKGRTNHSKRQQNRGKTRSG